MGCNSDYMRATPAEELSKQLMGLLLEAGLINHEAGYYGQPDKIDEHTQMLCQFCQNNDVGKCSLEFQIWWRDHQKADKERLDREQEALKTKNEREAALDKLTPYERKLLGV